MKETIGLVVGLLVILSAIPYGIRVYQRKITANVVSWSVWSVIGLALLLTYSSSGATKNIWPAVFSFTNPCLITALALWRGKRHWPNRLEIVCLVTGISAIALWWFVKDTKELALYALCLAIVADMVAAIPTIIFLWHSPWEDRPFAWGMFGLAYGLAMFSIEEHTFANYVLPVWMLAASGSIAFLLSKYRVQNNIPLREWW